MFAYWDQVYFCNKGVEIDLPRSSFLLQLIYFATNRFVLYVVHTLPLEKIFKYTKVRVEK